MTKVEATQLKAAARHLKSVSSRKEADKMVAKVPAPLDWAGGIRFGGEFKRMKRMNESDFPKRKAWKQNMIWVSELGRVVYYTTFVSHWMVAKLKGKSRDFCGFSDPKWAAKGYILQHLFEKRCRFFPGNLPHLTDNDATKTSGLCLGTAPLAARLCIKPKKSGLRITSCTSCHLCAA